MSKSDCKQLQGRWVYVMQATDGSEHKGGPLELFCTNGELKGRKLMVFDSVEKKPIYAEVTGEFVDGKYRIQFKDGWGCRFIIEITKVAEDKFEGAFERRDCEIPNNSIVNSGGIQAKRVDEETSKLRNRLPQPNLA